MPNCGSVKPIGARSLAPARSRRKRGRASGYVHRMDDGGATDKWAAWLLHRRDGDDAEQREKALEHLLPIRQRVLDNARISPGDTVLDVGAGDGLIAFGALDRVGVKGRVILSDLSSDLVAHARGMAAEAGADERMSF